MASRAARPEPGPGRGLSSSVRIGIEALDEGVDGALIVLGDQPLLSVETIRALLDASPDAARPIVVPVYGDDGGRNPVLLGRGAFGARRRGDGRPRPRAGDRGPPGARARGARSTPAGNPDIDTRADLVALLEAAWAARVRANAEQVDRFREVPDGTDFYAPVTGLFRADPTRTDEPALDALLRAGPAGRALARHRGGRRPLRPADRPGPGAVGRGGDRARSVRVDARRPSRDRRGARHRQRPRRRGALATRRCRPRSRPMSR